MEIQPTTSVAVLASAVPRAPRVFERLGIDYSCSGNLTLVDACTRAGIAPETVIAALAAKPSRGDHIDWRTRRPSELIEYLLATHHTATRELLERIGGLLDRVLEVHAQRHAFLPELARTFGLLRDDLLGHLMKEERILFPFIEALDRGQPAAAPFGDVSMPIAVMNEEHVGAAELIAAIHALTDDLTPPGDACATTRALYAAIEELERDLHLHMHLETNVLFPGAVALAHRYVKTTS